MRNMIGMKIFVCMIVMIVGFMVSLLLPEDAYAAAGTAKSTESAQNTAGWHGDGVAKYFVSKSGRVTYKLGVRNGNRCLFVLKNGKWTLCRNRVIRAMDDGSVRSDSEGRIHGVIPMRNSEGMRYWVYYRYGQRSRITFKWIKFQDRNYGKRYCYFDGRGVSVIYAFASDGVVRTTKQAYHNTIQGVRWSEQFDGPEHADIAVQLYFDSNGVVPQGKGGTWVQSTNPKMIYHLNDSGVVVEVASIRTCSKLNYKYYVLKVYGDHSQVGEFVTGGVHEIAGTEYYFYNMRGKAYMENGVFKTLEGTDYTGWITLDSGETRKVTNGQLEE